TYGSYRLGQLFCLRTVQPFTAVYFRPGTGSVPVLHWVDHIRIIKSTFGNERGRPGDSTYQAVLYLNDHRYQHTKVPSAFSLYDHHDLSFRRFLAEMSQEFLSGPPDGFFIQLTDLSGYRNFSFIPEIGMDLFKQLGQPERRFI